AAATYILSEDTRFITDVTATDPDRGDHVTFSIVDPNKSTPFAASPICSDRLPLLCSQPDSVLVVAVFGHRKSDRGASVFRLGQRLQLVRGRGVLVIHGRSVYVGARQAAVRVHRRWGNRWRASRSHRYDLAVGADRSGQPAGRGRRFPRG